MDNDKEFDMAVAAAKLVAAESKHGLSCPASKFPTDASVTMAYIPYQLDRTAYSPEEGLKAGTLFTSLNKPFLGRSVGNE